jgi:5'-deoxynucleotidase YfbR-like HD superfamily hydrolase
MQRIDEEGFLAFMRLLVRVQRVSADLPGGRRGNVIERAFYNCLIGLWRTRQGAHLNEERLIRLALVEPFMRYLELYPEDELAPELRPFYGALSELRAGKSLEAQVVLMAHGVWLTQEKAANPAFDEYLWLLDRVKGTIREIPVPGREARENDDEHSIHVALGVWYLAASYRLHRPVDLPRALVYALIHDVLEGPPGAGDTPVTGPLELRATKGPREEAGVRWIEARFTWLGELIREYLAQGDDTAVFANHVDKMEPWAMIGLAGSATWGQYGYSESWMLERQRDKCPSPDVGQLGCRIARLFIAEFGEEVPAARAG